MYSVEQLISSPWAWMAALACAGVAWFAWECRHPAVECDLCGGVSMDGEPLCEACRRACGMTGGAA